jgi:head-tail adaptor
VEIEMKPQSYNRALERIRKFGVLFLTEQCQLERHSQTVNTAGQQIGDWTLVEVLPCRVIPIRQRGNMGEVGDREANRSFFKFELEGNAPVRDGDRLRHKNQIYEILEISAPLTDQIFMSVQTARIAE